MKTSQVKQHILSFLVNEHDKGNKGLVDVEPLAAQLGIPVEHIDTVLALLHMQRLVKLMGLDHAMLTSKGIEAARSVSLMDPHPSTADEPAS